MNRFISNIFKFTYRGRIGNTLEVQSWREFSHSPSCLQNAVEETTGLSHPDMPVPNMPNPYEREKKICILCKYKVPVDYKNTKLLSQFVSRYTGKIYDKHITGLCQKQQERVVMEIKKAHSAGIMPKYLKDAKFFKDPKLYDPFKPSRPHPH